MDNKIVWDDIGSRTYEGGVDHGVLYKYSGGEFIDGVAWNGLTSVTFKSSRESVTPLYTGDDIKTDFTYGYDDGTGTIKAYTYPEGFEPMLGVAELAAGIYGKQQDREFFGLSYRTMIGNAIEGESAGYKIHLLYNLYIVEGEEAWNSLSSDPGAYEFSFPVSAMPLDVGYGGYDPLCEVIIDSRRFAPDRMVALEYILYGSETAKPRMPLPDELIDLFDYTEIPESYAGYPHERVYPSTNLYPEKIPNPMYSSSIQIGVSSEKTNHFFLQEPFVAGTYRIVWTMYDGVTCTENRLVITNVVENVYCSDTIELAGRYEYSFAVSEAQVYCVSWEEENVSPATTLEIVIVKTN